MRGMSKQTDGTETQAPDLLSRLTNRGSRRGFLATLGAVLGGGLGLFAAQAPVKADDDDDWDDWDDDDGWDDGYWRYPDYSWDDDDDRNDWDDDDDWDDWDDDDDWGDWEDDDDWDDWDDDDDWDD